MRRSSKGAEQRRAEALSTAGEAPPVATATNTWTAAISSNGKGALSRASKMGSGALSTVKGRIPYLSPTTASSTSVSGSSTPERRKSVGDSTSLLPHESIRPTSHREKTAMHALKDTFVLPSLHLNPASFLPSLPTIPCMSGLGQSALFVNDNDDERITAVVAPSPRTSVDGARPDMGEASGVGDGAFKRLQGNVLMMGGYRGSILRDASTGRRLWVPLRVGFNVRRADLAIGLTDEDEQRTRETVVPGKALAAIAGFVDLGKRLKDRLKSLDAEGKIQFHGWGYDWRKSLELSSLELIQHLTRIKQETGSGTLVIAHSMGGLVTLHALARAEDPTIFKGIIFGSTPFAGTANILQPFRHGDSILFNKQICSPATVFSFRSSFYLLPPDGACFQDSEGSATALDFLSPQPWIKYGLSPVTSHLLDADGSAARQDAINDAGIADPAIDALLGGMQQMGEVGRTTNATPATAVASPRLPAPGNGQNRRDSDSSDGTQIESESSDDSSHESNQNVADKTPDPAILAYLQRTLRNVKTFRKQLSDGYNPTKKHLYPPLVVLSSQKTPTVKGCVVDSEREIQDGQYDRLLFGEGDGIILHRSAIALPEVWQPHVVSSLESSFGHVSILSDMITMKKAIDAVLVANATRS